MAAIQNNISGPVIIGYFKNEALNKKIILIGDIHGDKEGKCEINDISITDYIDQLAKQNLEENYNLFVEIPIPIKSQLQQGSIETGITPMGGDFLGDLLNYSYKNYKKIPNLNIHFIDVRVDLNKPFIDSVVNTYRNKVMALVELLSNVESFKKPINYLDIFNTFAEEYTSYIYASLMIISDKKKLEGLEKFSSDLLLKETQKLEENNSQVYITMSKIVIDYIRKYLDIVLSDRYIDNMGDINELYLDGIRASAIITDFYTLARIFKSNEYINNIIYVGRAHYDSIRQILVELGFNLVNEINADEHEHRCIKGAIEFEKFFEDPYLKPQREYPTLPPSKD